MYPEDDILVRARQACAEGRRAEVEAIYAALDQNDSRDVSWGWHISKLLGKEQQATDALQPYATSGVPHMLSSYLIYNSFDPRPFPEIMAVLDREGVTRPPVVEIPIQVPAS